MEKALEFYFFLKATLLLIGIVMELKSNQINFYYEKSTSSFTYHMFEYRNSYGAR